MAIGQTVYGRLKQRQGSSAALAAANPVLAAGEFTASINGTTVVLKIGDGVTHWLDLPPIGGDGGGGAGDGSYPVRQTIFEASVIPRNPANGNVGSITWDEVSWQTVDPDTGDRVVLTEQPDWGGYTVSDLFLTHETNGAGFYDFTVNMAIGLPVAADFPDGFYMRVDRDTMDPIYRYFPRMPAPRRGLGCGWSTGPVWVDADDGSRITAVASNDPLTSALTFFGSNGVSVDFLRVTMTRLSGMWP